MLYADKCWTISGPYFHAHNSKFNATNPEQENVWLFIFSMQATLFASAWEKKAREAR